jgi:transglutaminase-like putative cysteine protease
MALQALPLALVLFVFFPRLDAPLWNLGLDNPNAVTGLKDWLEPGSVTDLVISGEDAMRVHFDRPPPIVVDRMYWRGPVLWHARGNRFEPARHGEFPEATVDVAPISEPIGYTALLEASDQRWITALDGPIGAPRGATLTPDLQVLADRPIDERRLFRLRSALSYRAAGLTLEEEAAATQLPEDKVTPRMRALVAGWTADDPPAETVVERALAYFNQQPFRYTLLAPDMGEKAADTFLFEARAGFCEHYAAAFTLLMRIAGIPTRIVLGYLGGERNPYSDDYLIRQSEAHAWTEVWLDGRGWTRVDPTAAVAANRVDPEGEFARLGAGAPARFRLDHTSSLGRLLYNLRLAADAFDAAWQQWVADFSHFKQQRLLANIGLGPLRDIGLVAVMALAGAVVMLAWGLWLARPPGAADPVVAAYADFQRRLRRIDPELTKRPDEGPLDHLARLAAARPELVAAAEPVVDAYVRLRYAGSSAGPDLLGRLRRAVRNLH